MDGMKLFAVCALCTAHPGDAPAASPVTSTERPTVVDHWQSFISEAAQQFGIPDTWIRRVMATESGGRTTLRGRPITSRAGAMGLMQMMPQTYRSLRAQYGLGGNAYDPRANILAGAAYLRQMYERYGYPSLFAAYNAGPKRLDDFLLRGHALPQETINYVQTIVPGAQIALGTTPKALEPTTIGPAANAAANTQEVHSNDLFFVRNDANSGTNEDDGPAPATPRNAARAAIISEPNGAQLFVPLSHGSR